MTNITNDEKWVHTSIIGLTFFESKIVNIFLSVSLNMCFGCSKELFHLDGSFEYPQHIFWLRIKKNIFLVCTLKDIYYCPLEIIKGLIDKGQFQYLTKLMGPQEGTYISLLR